MAPGAGVIDQDHGGDGDSAKNVERNQSRGLVLFPVAGGAPEEGAAMVWAVAMTRFLRWRG